MERACHIRSEMLSEVRKYMDSSRVLRILSFGVRKYMDSSRALKIFVRGFCACGVCSLILESTGVPCMPSSPGGGNFLVLSRVRSDEGEAFSAFCRRRETDLVAEMFRVRNDEGGASFALCRRRKGGHMLAIQRGAVILRDFFAF